MKTQSHILIRYKFNVAIIFLTALTLFASCNKTDTPVTPPAAAATIAGVTGPTGLTSGPKNTVITISGTNFITDLGQIQVKVNGKTCTVLTATSTSITAQIPPACGTGIVEIFLNGTRYAGPVFNFIFTYTLSSVTNGQVGYADGPLATAKFEEINGIAIDANDNIYIPQWTNPRIRKITAAGIASNLAGNGIRGYVDAQGANARFLSMDYGSTDQAGNLYVADQTTNTILNPNRIRKIDINGNVTTFAVVPHHLYGIKVGKLGNIYVSGADGISKYTSSGTLAWRLMSHGTGNVDGDTSIVQFNLFGNIEVDDTETNIYVSNLLYPGSQLKKLNLTTKSLTTIAGDGTSGDVGAGPALSCKFRLISSSVLDNSGGLYFTDFDNNKIYYLKDGTVVTIINGVYGSILDVDGDASVARIAGSLGMAFDSHGQLYIGCLRNNKIKKLVMD
jgi:IPT/TIG domain